MIVAELERALLARYPMTDAEPWDHIGLSVGDPDDEIRGVACALDATEVNVHRALEAGVNVLLTILRRLRRFARRMRRVPSAAQHCLRPPAAA